MASAETLRNYHTFKGKKKEPLARPIACLFLEGFPYDKDKGVKEDNLKTADIEMLTSLKKIAVRVIGLETEKTVPPGKTVQEQQKFAREYRCTIANEEWALLVKKEGQEAALNVVCCGTAHLVSMEEKDGICKSLEEHFKRAQINSTKSLAVAYSNGGLYEPEGANESVKAMDPIDENFLDEGSESDSDD
jgi:hypothetical protein